MDALETQSQSRQSTSPSAGRAFSITELLVVIAIIVLLAGLLMVAMGKVRESSLRTTTLSTMQNFARAADAFQTEHGSYPGVIPESVLAAAMANSAINVTTGPAGTRLTSTENALLHLMGGYRVCPPGTPGCASLAMGKSPLADDYIQFDIGPNGREFEIGKAPNLWRLKVNLNRLGEGPNINGKPYAPYFTPGPNEVRVVPHARDAKLPDLVDAWGAPILFTRRIRNSGPLVGKADASGPERPQFVLDGLSPYLESDQLGERGIPQNEGVGKSILFQIASNQGPIVHARFAQIIRHPGFGSWTVNPLTGDNLGRVAPRGEYVLISAGPDGIYFSAADGPGSPGNPIKAGSVREIIPSHNNQNQSNPDAIRSFDDIVIFGGG